MSVTQLLCEGEEHSPDIRVLSKLLAGFCEIKPSGSKHGIGEKIIARREILGQNCVFGILDGDFQRQWKPPTNRPEEWQIKNGSLHLGWRWERKEIENYLIDPEIVKRVVITHSLDLQCYKTELELIKNKIAVYQAARSALSANRIPLYPLPSAFGSKRGKEKHLFPDALSREFCEAELKRIISGYNDKQFISPDHLISSFASLLPEFTDKGVRNRYYLHAFAGKDIFWAMDQWLEKHGFGGASAFKEKILTGIQNTCEDISIWLPEWAKFKEMVSSI